MRRWVRGVSVTLTSVRSELQARGSPFPYVKFNTVESGNLVVHRMSTRPTTWRHRQLNSHVSAAAWPRRRTSSSRRRRCRSRPGTAAHGVGTSSCGCRCLRHMLHSLRRVVWLGVYSFFGSRPFVLAYLNEHARLPLWVDVHPGACSFRFPDDRSPPRT